MKKTIIALCATAAFILIAGFLIGSFVLGNNSFYYTQIDNSKYSMTDKKGSTYYTYKLPACSAGGDIGELCFDTVRELRADAFLKIEVSNVLGVVNWEEVQWNDLPEIVRSAFRFAESAG